ncbi:MAG: lactate racemase domain-containing protein [Meiothermus sp.]|nr:lactate racemase domain-containing protein [Meiothermus sp.]
MQEVTLDYGDGVMGVNVPDSASVVRYGQTFSDPPEIDPFEATRHALEHPLGMEPLRELAKAGQKVVISFPDRVKGGAHPKAHRRVAIPIIVEVLREAGVALEDITLLCAVGLHRHNTHQELLWYLGKDIINAFWPDRIVMHDAEDPAGIVDLGQDKMGNVVDCNRLLAEADLSILIGHVQGNPYGGYSGGYKMAVTGTTSWRSIRSHHNPDTMHRDDYLPASTHSHMRHQFDSMGRAMEQALGKRFFAVDAVIGSRAQVLGVYAGAIEQVQKASWRLASQRTDVELDSTEPFDVLVFGLPRAFHYGPGMGSNPILMLQSIAAQLTRCYGVFREGGVIIAPAICDGWFNPSWFPSYERAYNKLQELSDFADIFDHQDHLASDPDAIFRYRFDYAYHPGHALSMVSMGAIAHQHTSAILVPGAKSPGHARGMGCIPTKTFDEALRYAERYVGKNPRILLTPDAFRVAGVHLQLKR